MRSDSVFFPIQLDYTCGVLPVTKVDGFQDSIDALTLKERKSANNISKNAYDLYDAKAMHGLPVGVQVVGKRLGDHRLLEIAQALEALLQAHDETRRPIVDFASLSA